MRPNEISGQVIQYEEPFWDPLLDLAADQVDFMWMFEAKFDDGTALHAYKHRWTRPGPLSGWYTQVYWQGWRR